MAAGVVNQNNALPPHPAFPLGDAEHPDLPRGPVVTQLVNELKAACAIEKLNASGQTNYMKWILIAVGVSLAVLGWGLLGAAFATSNPLLGQIGLYLISASVLSFAAIPLFTPTDYSKADLVTPELFAFAHRKKIDFAKLTPDTVIMYNKVMELTLIREEAEKKPEADPNQPAPPALNPLP